MRELIIVWLTRWVWGKLFLEKWRHTECNRVLVHLSKKPMCRLILFIDWEIDVLKCQTTILRTVRLAVLLIYLPINDSWKCFNRVSYWLALVTLSRIVLLSRIILISSLGSLFRFRCFRILLVNFSCQAFHSLVLSEFGLFLSLHEPVDPLFRTLLLLVPGRTFWILWKRPISHRLRCIAARIPISN